LSFRTEPALAPSIEEFAPPAWGLALGLFVALVVQSTLLALLPVRDAFPSLVLTLVIWYALRSGPRAALLYGTLAGACEDALAATAGAAWMFSTAFVAFGAGLLGLVPQARTRWGSATIVAVLTLARFVAFLVVERIEGRSLTLVTPHLHAVVWQSLFNALLMSLGLVLQARAVAYRVARR
jgi:cell shape-determining protein MreD